MNIQTLVDNHSPEVALLFETYGIQAPVNRNTLASAIALNSTSTGNPFLEDLTEITVMSNYDGYEEDFLKKARAKVFGTKETRQAKREERGGYSRVGSIIRKVGIAKNKGPKGGPRVTTGAIPMNLGGPVLKGAIDVLSQTASEAPTDPNEPQAASKITGQQVAGTIGTIGQAVSDISNIFKGGNANEAGGNEDNGANPASGGGLKKWLPLIIGGVVVLGIVLVLVFKKK